MLKVRETTPDGREIAVYETDTIKVRGDDKVVTVDAVPFSPSYIRLCVGPHEWVRFTRKGRGGAEILCWGPSGCVFSEGMTYDDMDNLCDWWLSQKKEKA